MGCPAPSKTMWSGSTRTTLGSPSGGSNDEPACRWLQRDLVGVEPIDDGFSVLRDDLGVQRVYPTAFRSHRSESRLAVTRSRDQHQPICWQVAVLRDLLFNPCHRRGATVLDHFDRGDGRLAVENPLDDNVDLPVDIEVTVVKHL